MITLRVTQRTYPVVQTQVLDDLRRICALLSGDTYGCSVWITTDETIRRYNRTYRGIDTATDILSFPYHTDYVPGTPLPRDTDEDAYLGDIIISAPYVARAAEQLGVSFDEHLRRLLVHGMCHLLNYDHHTPAEYEAMRAQELRICNALDIRDTVGDYAGRDTW